MRNCESCKTVGIKSTATTRRNGENVCAECAEEIDSRKMRTGYFCDTCDTEIEGDYCAAHPKASVSSVRVPA